MTATKALSLATAGLALMVSIGRWCVRAVHADTSDLSVWGI